ncbi:helix-turn-helix transcriptional regulator [Nonomuraea sp. NPDC049129]|uniref:helix-turn-helix domain-containing protein n=1 Tax=Nonomuraea sp. NPDC049129 TaxID=3155272 RepID=UPI0033C43FA8
MAGLLVDLPTLLREAREDRELSLRSAAEQIGYSRSTLGRIEAGECFRVDIAVAVLRWLGTPAPSGANRPQPVRMPVDGTASAVNRTDMEATRAQDQPA